MLPIDTPSQLLTSIGGSIDQFNGGVQSLCSLCHKVYKDLISFRFQSRCDLWGEEIAKHMPYAHMFPGARGERGSPPWNIRDTRYTVWPTSEPKVPFRWGMSRVLYPCNQIYNSCELLILSSWIEVHYSGLYPPSCITSILHYSIRLEHHNHHPPNRKLFRDPWTCRPGCGEVGRGVSPKAGQTDNPERGQSHGVRFMLARRKCVMIVIYRLVEVPVLQSTIVISEEYSLDKGRAHRVCFSESSTIAVIRANDTAG